MSFDELLEATRALLEQEGRVAYRVLKRRFDLDDEDIEDIKADLIDAKRIAVDEDGRVLVAIGSALAEGEPAGQSHLEGRLPVAAGADRRLITVMFCDIVGSTELSGRFDAEELREVVRSYQSICGTVITRHEGHVAQYLGDGLLVYFGYPTALEDEAERCVQAAIEILEELNAASDLKARIGAPLRVRIGIHSGRVVIGEMGGTGRLERLALGETPNIAARVQSSARPNEILITAATQRLVDGLFECELHGPHTLKGVRDPIELYTVKGTGLPLNRFEVALSTGNLSRFVGRKQELGFLSHHWSEACEGRGQIVLMSGEAGMGKSRLAQEFKKSVGEHARQITLRCSPSHRNSAYYPLALLFRRVFALENDDSDSVQADKLERALGDYAFSKDTTAPIFADLLGIKHPRAEQIDQLDHAHRKTLLVESVIDWFLEEGATRPVYVIVDDVHWMDPATYDLLSLYLDHIGSSATLALLIYRSDFSPRWSPRSTMSQLSVGRLPVADSEAMIASVAGGQTVSKELVAKIDEKADGIPLFIEEITKAVLAADGPDPTARNGARGDLPGLPIPSTLQDSLEARLDRCPSGRIVAQWGATIGREFPHALLAFLITDRVTLSNGLDELLEAELIYRSGTRSDPSYIFKHALIRDTASGSLLTRDRRDCHAQIADVLEEHFADTVEREPERIAEHYAAAGVHDRAAEYLLAAGHKAIERAVSTVARNHLEMALAQAEKLVEPAERARIEIPILLLLGPLLSSAHGNSSADVERVYKRILKLGEHAGDKASRFPAYFGLRAFYLANSDLNAAHEIGEALYRAAQNSGHVEYLLEANVALAGSCFYRGEFASALQHAEQGFSHYDPKRHHQHAWTYGIEPGALALVRSAHSSWISGYPDRARSRMRQALAISDASGHGASRAFTYRNASTFAVWLGEYHDAEAFAYTAVEIAGASEIAFDQGWGLIQLGHARVCQGQSGVGVADIERGLEKLRHTAPEETIRSQLMYPLITTLVADARGRSGDAEKGLAILPEAIAVIERLGARYCEPIVYRVRGDLLAQLEHRAEAEISLGKSIELARASGARSLELQATISLARLQPNGERALSARAALGDLLEVFTEGNDSNDLRSARALFAELT